MPNYWGLVYDAKDAMRAGWVTDTEEEALDLIATLERADELAGLDQTFTLWKWIDGEWRKADG